jgi:alkyl sulfatase BDS1-like metallo-beta-lactamase superfamily hydrolase
LNHYRYGEAQIVEGSWGQLANRVLMENRKLVEPQALRIRDDLYSLMGLSICNMHLVIGPEGLIVIDTGRSTADGEQILAYADELSDKPVVAVIYTHSHYTKGTSPILERYPDAAVVAHHKVHRNTVHSMSGPRRFTQRRGRMESARFLPERGPDADATGSRIFTPGGNGYVPPTMAIREDGEEHRIAGVRIRFHTRYPFDTNDTLLMWLPQQQAIIHNHFAGNFPNVYPIQGGRYRNPEPWLQGLDAMRAYEPEHILSTHGPPDSGRERCAERLTAVRDALQFVHDQTIRGMNKHLTPQQLVDFVQLPPELRDHPDLTQTYGEVPNHVRGIFSGIVGWFDGDAASIHPPPPEMEAARVIEAFGGVHASVEKLHAALDDGEYSWAARIGQWLMHVDPESEEVRAAQAAALRKLGQVSTAWTVRNYFLSAARELEGAVDTRDIPKTLNPESALLAAPGTFVRALAYRADPARFPAEELRIAVLFTGEVDGERQARFGLILRRGVAEFVEHAPVDPAVTIRTPRRTWIAMVDAAEPPVTLLDQPGVEVDPDRPTAERALAAFE